MLLYIIWDDGDDDDNCHYDYYNDKNDGDDDIDFTDYNNNDNRMLWYISNLVCWRWDYIFPQFPETMKQHNCGPFN